MTNTTSKKQRFNNACKAVANIRNIRLSTPGFTAVKESLEELMIMRKEHDVIEGILLQGETGAGKSTSLTKFVDENKPIVHPEFTEVPVISVSVPSSPTINSLAAEILCSYGQTYTSGSAAELTRRIRVLAKECKTKVIIFDEAQHLVDIGQKKTHMKSADWIKELMTPSKDKVDGYGGLSVVLCGLPRIEVLMNANDQLRRRFSKIILLEGWDVLGGKAVRKDFMKVVINFVDVSGFSDNREEYIKFLWDEEVITSLLFATNGRMAYISMLVSGAIKNAILDGRASFKIEDFEKSFRENIWFGATGATNPFSRHFRGTSLTGLNEPFCREAA